ncbi:MAG: ABC transporter substrate-binding protein [Rhizobiales bacterium]|nr:ABC transporter substrate-binding protein [Hyphomicrobiales bacterium]
MSNVCVIRLSLLVAAIAAALVVPAQAETRVKLFLDYRFEGPSAPYLVAADRGYYKTEDLDVVIDTASTPLEPITRVASGDYDIGIADINALIKYRDANPAAPVMAVFMVYNRPPFAIIGRKSRGVTKPKDLEGKKLGAPAADPATAPWKIFAKVNDIDVANVAVDNVGLPVREPMLAAGQVDAITGLSFSTYIALKDRGVPPDDIVVMLMADYGVVLYGNAIIVNSKFAATNPQAVRGFLRALVKGLKETIKNPQKAVESVLRRNDVAKKDLELERLRMAIKDNIVTPEVKADGLGGVNALRLAASIEQIGLGYEFKAKPGASAVFDASFLPDINQRKLN